MTKLLFFCFFFLQFYFVTSLTAQDFELRGRVTDSLQVSIPGVGVRIYTIKDSLSTGTDKNGNFRFRSLTKGNMTLVVWSMGYEIYKQNLNYTGENAVYELPSIILQTKFQRLQEVVAKAPDLIRIAKDTVEYNASTYAVGEHDRLEDLLRQLPGVRIDAFGNVMAMGEPMTKLRVNGKDFFTNNLKEFLNQLPAGIIAKLQVIDDYGDQANFTGIKVGKPQKMLNLVIKDGQSKGAFGSTETSASTQKLFSAGLQGNLWLDVHQLSANANHTNTRTEEGRQRTTNAGVNYRRSGDQVNFYSNYGYSTVKRTGDSESYSESVTSKGTLYNRIQQSSTNGNQGQQVQLNLQSRKKKDFWNIQVSGQKNTGSSENRNISKQSGVIVQDLDNVIQSNSKNNTGNLALSWSRNMYKQGRSLSANLSGSVQRGKEESHIQDQLRFYDQRTGGFLKDSVNMRLLHEKKDLRNLGFSAKYVEPLNDYTLEKTKRSLDIGYNFSLRSEKQLRETQVLKEGILQRIDSLSNDYGTLFSIQQLDLSYRVESPKMQYSLGLSLFPAIMHVDDSKLGRISYRIINFLPIASIRYLASLKNSIQFNYMGSSTAPTVNQLIPLRDLRSLQQVTIGNPELKPTKNHGLSLNLNRIEPVKGQTYNLSFSGSVLQNQIASNVLLLPDTLGTLRQEIHYLNVDGSYSLGASYDMTLPFAKIYQFRSGTQLSKNRSIIYLDEIKEANSTIYLSQNLSVVLNKTKFRGTLNLNYYITNSTYKLNHSLRSYTSTLEINSDARWTIFPSLIVGAGVNYRMNGGYRIPIKNPILINASVELFLTAKKELSIQLQGYDLLDQQQSVNLMISNNNITQQTFNRIGRYVLLIVKYNLSRFGGKE
ncbi:TonB-dependent receptor family protein [Sphingobacterium sp. SRCM116780]|uniref:TonB-dependent receptor n=1 Tax=Sphingobacterium sp. SRCM116780 TaxID=2907623 RepID=UPI001F3DCF57|nr:TonB-dependent receptor [Sphingobacterium sp. SRCM116780]UIR57390.1 TonB-dependent receptor family protein [Sphingobacterium sp. SRCM116780]